MGYLYLLPPLSLVPLTGHDAGSCVVCATDSPSGDGVALSPVQLLLRTGRPPLSLPSPMHRRRQPPPLRSVYRRRHGVHVYV